MDTEAAINSGIFGNSDLNDKIEQFIQDHAETHYLQLPTPEAYNLQNRLHREHRELERLGSTA